MKKLVFKVLVFAIVGAMVFSSCSKDENNDVVIADKPVDITDNNQWNDSTVNGVDVIWYRVSCEANSYKAYVEWAEKDAQGESRDYTGDVRVSAYMLDGQTPYFENKSTGYGAKARTFIIDENETKFLLKVEVDTTGIPGTFGIRTSTIPKPTDGIYYTDLYISNAWTQSTIAKDSSDYYIVNFGSATKLAIIWSEIDSPEKTHTADVLGSVFDAGGTIPYQYDKEGSIKTFLDKNKSHSDEPKVIITKTGDDNIKIQIKGVSDGTYAIKIVDYSNL